MKRFLRAGINTGVFSTPGISLQDWEKVKEEVSEAIKNLNAEGFEVENIRWLCEINEITPCNVDRNKAFFRITGVKDSEE